MKQRKEVHWFRPDGKKIYGELYLPETDLPGPYPLVVFCHELLHTGRTGRYYAEKLAAEGFAMLLFDFCGGAYNSRSDGSIMDMSVMTEAADLEAVLEEICRSPEIDAGHITLMGGSQGAVVATVVATRHPEWFDALIALYPPYSIPEDTRAQFPDKEAIPEICPYTDWFTGGRCYGADVWDYDVFEEMKMFTKPVLLLHGTEDELVPETLSERAAECFPDAELHLIPGGHHIFSGECRRIAGEFIIDFVRRHR